MKKTEKRTNDTVFVSGEKSNDTFGPRVRRKNFWILAVQAKKSESSFFANKRTRVVREKNFLNIQGENFCEFLSTNICDCSESETLGVFVVTRVEILFDRVCNESEKFVIFREEKGACEVALEGI